MRFSGCWRASRTLFNESAEVLNGPGHAILADAARPMHGFTDGREASLSECWRPQESAAWPPSHTTIAFAMAVDRLQALSRPKVSGIWQSAMPSILDWGFHDHPLVSDFVAGANKGQ